MKKYLLYTTAVILIFAFNACKINEPYYYNYNRDDQPPAPPNGVVIYNGDNRVDISWYHNSENDVAGYNVYYSYSYDGKYNLIGSTEDNYFIDYDAHNGNTYYYAVAAYDYNGNESELSFENVNATPRPEGYNQSVFDYLVFPDNSGYSFSSNSIVPYDSKASDFFFENYKGTFYLDVWNDTDIKDMGPTNDIYDVPYAPNSGWSSTKDAYAIVGHTYVVWTVDNHFAKIRVKSITRDRIVFDWAYQLIPGNVQLKPKTIQTEERVLTRSFER